MISRYFWRIEYHLFLQGASVCKYFYLSPSSFLGFWFPPTFFHMTDNTLQFLFWKYYKSGCKEEVLRICHKYDQNQRWILFTFLLYIGFIGTLHFYSLNFTFFAVRADYQLLCSFYLGTICCMYWVNTTTYLFRFRQQQLG